MEDLRHEIIKCKTEQRAMELINMVVIQNKALIKWLSLEETKSMKKRVLKLEQQIKNRKKIFPKDD